MNNVQTDLNSGAMFNMPFNVPNISPEISFSMRPAGGTYRGIGSSWFNAENILKENWLRDQQTANNAFIRDMIQQQYANEFNASEAQKQRDFEEYLSSTSYQRAVDDMKKAGINPILAYSSGGSSTPSFSAPSSSAPSRSSSSSSGRSDSSAEDILLKAIISIAGLLLPGGKSIRKIGFGK